MKLLLVRLSAMGDVVMTLPLAADLARAGHEVHWLVNAAYAPLVTACSAVSCVHAWRGLSSAAAAVTVLRRERFAAVIDAQGLWKSALPAKCAGGRLVGLELTREPVAWLYDERLPAAGWDEHALLRYRRLGAAFGADRSAPPQYGVAGAPHAAVAAKLAALCPGDGPLLVANPNARWASKRWPAASWAELLRQFPQARRLLIGAADERAATQAIADAVPGAANAAGVFDLRELWTVVGLADAVVTTDSAAQHIAAAQDRPLTVLFGPTDPQRTGPGPYATHTQVLRAPGCPQQPCFRRTCPRRNCLDDIPVELAAASVRAALTKVN